MINEKDFENKIIDLLTKEGYEYINSDEMIDCRKNLSEVILYDELISSIRKINDISEEMVKLTIDKVKRMDESDLITGNKAAVKAMSSGIKIYDDESDITKTVKLIDIENVNNNIFYVTDQFRVSSKHIHYKNQIPDLVIYINGLPVSVIELKNPMLDESKSIDEAYKQIKNYQINIPRLFTWNIINIISNMNINRYGSLTSPYTRYSNWRSLTNDKSLPHSYFFKNLLNKNNIISLVTDYTIFTEQQNPNKIVAGYHQVKGVAKASLDIINSIENKSGKAGIFWHTQGSGKSLSMVFLTRKVNKHFKKMTTIVITDRKDLDNQLAQTFINSSNFLNQEVKQIGSIKDLQETLIDKKQNGVYLCTVQKFNESIGLLSLRDDILILTDEAHRSHNNINKRLEVVIDEMEINEKYGYAYFLRNAFPNASFMGFTGTPIESEDIQTKKIFGDYSTKYLMSDATKDGFVVPINYESRHKKLKVIADKKSELDRVYEEIKSEIIDKTELKIEVTKNINKKLQKMDIIIGDQDRIDEISKDFVIHYNKRKNLLKGKALFVAYNRDIAYRYYKKIIELDPTLKDKVRLILTANNQKDPKDMLKVIGTDKYRSDSEVLFKDPESKFKIAIVVDMWLTGFDAPSLDTLYIDKPIKMHNLMQTIARVNRTYTDENNHELVKQSGLIVDYIGLWSKLKTALEFYTKGGGDIKESTPEDIDLLKINIMEFAGSIYNKDLDSKIIIDHKNINNSKYLFNIVEEIQNIIIEKDKKQDFVNKIKLLKKSFPAIITSCDDEEKIYLQLLLTASSLIIKRELGNIDIDMKVKEIRQLIADSIIANKEIIFSDNKRIDLTDIINSILNSKISEESTSLEIEKLAKRAKRAILEIAKFNIVRSEKLSEKLDKLLEKYDSNHITQAEFETDFMELVKEMNQIKDSFDSSDRDIIETSFYEIIMDEQMKTNYDIKMIGKITKELYLKVKPHLDHSWLRSEGAKQKVRSEMKKILIGNGYPPGATKELQEKLVNQLDNQILNNAYDIGENYE